MVLHVTLACAVNKLVHRAASLCAPGHRNFYMGVFRNRGTPKWMVIMENPIKMDDFGVLGNDLCICSFPENMPGQTDKLNFGMVQTHQESECLFSFYCFSSVLLLFEVLVLPFCIHLGMRFCNANKTLGISHWGLFQTSIDRYGLCSPAWKGSVYVCSIPSMGAGSCAKWLRNVKQFQKKGTWWSSLLSFMDWILQSPWKKSNGRMSYLLAEGLWPSYDLWLFLLISWSVSVFDRNYITSPQNLRQVEIFMAGGIRRRGGRTWHRCPWWFGDGSCHVFPTEATKRCAGTQRCVTWPRKTMVVWLLFAGRSCLLFSVGVI